MNRLQMNIYCIIMKRNKNNEGKIFLKKGM
jgi:hypothetical protein